jgi:hypothetical protein
MVEARELTAFDDVRQSIDEVLAIMVGERYGRGSRLVKALESSAQAAISRGERDLAERLRNFASYAAGVTPLSLVETRYDSRARESSEHLVRELITLAGKRLIPALDELIADNPAATAIDVRNLVQGVLSVIGNLGLASGDEGTRLTPRDKELLFTLGKLELVMKHLPTAVASEVKDLVDELAESPDAALMAQLVALRSREASLKALRIATSDPASSEGELHACLKNQEWIFGGAYAGESFRRKFAPEAILDIPLLRGDGSLHVVELKRANIRDLVVRNGAHLMLGAQVHRAVSQTQDYLRDLDENRNLILEHYGVDTRRASATVVIGHADFVNPELKAELASVLRQFNSHLSRIEVVTYSSLVASAERMLAISSDETKRRVGESDRERGGSASSEPPP